MDVHSRDVVAELHKERVITVTDFKWLAQLRYYWMVGTRKKVQNSMYVRVYVRNTSLYMYTYIH